MFPMFKKFHRRFILYFWFPLHLCEQSYPCMKVNKSKNSSIYVYRQIDKYEYISPFSLPSHPYLSPSSPLPRPWRVLQLSRCFHALHFSFTKSGANRIPPSSSCLTCGASFRGWWSFPAACGRREGCGRKEGRGYEGKKGEELEGGRW